VLLLVIQGEQSSDCIQKPVLVLTHYSFKSNFFNFSVLGFQFLMHSWLTCQRKWQVCLMCLLTCFRSHSGPVVPALWSLLQCWKHAPLPVPGGLHRQLLRGAAGWVWLQPLPERCYLPGSPGWIPVRGNAWWFSRKRSKDLEHCNAEQSKEIRNMCKW